MLNKLEEWRREKEQRKILLALYDEMAANLESYYVMFQIKQFRFFKTEVGWPTEMSKWITSGNGWGLYRKRLDGYNLRLKDFKDYETWYGDDISRKTKENGMVLHQKKQDVQNAFEGLEAVIKTAYGELVKELTLKKWLKDPRVF